MYLSRSNIEKIEFNFKSSLYSKTRQDKLNLMILRSGKQIDGVNYENRYETLYRFYILPTKLMYCEYHEDKSMSSKELFVRRTIHYIHRHRSDMYRFIERTYAVHRFMEDLYKKSSMMYNEIKIDDWSMMHEDPSNMSFFEWNMSFIMKEHNEDMKKDVEFFMYKIYRRLMIYHRHIINQKKLILQSYTNNMCPHVVDIIFSYII